ncbi:D-alanyl-D-alanine carboxypeptidase [Acrocarpospora sp. B8E8]|uniref:D-alanyl-D-alanine carboxypeptidase family protein n=1 Tax=Acrocarpospora sp. B8E8 TaxID=3153572 RepID=UPI00325C3814
MRIGTSALGVAVLTTALVGAGQSSARADTIGGEQLAGTGLVLPPGAKAPPKSKASAFVIADAETGQVLAAKNPHGRFLPASTLKALTAVTLIPKLNKNKRVQPSREACNIEGSAVGLVPKPIYQVDDLFRALLMVSGNDAAHALAEANGGVPATLADMNAEARRLQANDTVAKTPSGLDEPGQSSSAYDLALIARAGLKLPSFKDYISTKTAKFPAPKGYYEIGNHNKLLWTYNGMVGVKNGWTSKAQGSFVGAARRNGHTVIVAIMRHEGSFWSEVADLLDWGFANRGKVAPVGTLVNPLPDHTPTPLAKSVTPIPAAADVATTTVEKSGTPLVATLVLIGSLTGGLVWIGYGIRRRARRR